MSKLVTKEHFHFMLVNQYYHQVTAHRFCYPFLLTSST